MTPSESILALARCQAEDAMLVGWLVDVAKLTPVDAHTLVKELGAYLDYARLGAQATAWERIWGLGMGTVDPKSVNGYAVTALMAIAKAKLGCSDVDSKEVRDLLDRAKSERAKRKGLHAA